MSLTTELIERLRKEADGYMGYRSKRAVRVKHLLREAADTIEQLSAKVRKENGFIFPDNPTNGDVIKAMFPNIDTNFSNVIDLNLWWKAPYKDGDTE